MVQGAKAGKISKPYGLQGEVQVILNPLIVKHIKSGTPLFIMIDGQGVPFFMKSVDLLADDLAHIQFEFIHTVEEAREVCGCEVFLDPKASKAMEGESEDPESVVGYLAIDQHLGALGTVKEYIPNPMNPQWSIELRGKEMLIPANADFVLEIKRKLKQIHFSLPDGLSEL